VPDTSCSPIGQFKARSAARLSQTADRFTFTLVGIGTSQICDERDPDARRAPRHVICVTPLRESQPTECGGAFPSPRAKPSRPRFEAPGGARSRDRGSLGKKPISGPVPSVTDVRL
jgi:hypothetical protein